MAIKDHICKDDFIYFFSIIAAFISLSFLKQISFQDYLQEYFKFTYTPKNIIFIWGGLILISASFKAITVTIKKQEQKKQPMWQNDTGLIFGTLLLFSLLYGFEQNRNICDQKRVYQLLTWFLIGRISNFIGNFFNRFGSIISWNTFGNSLSFFTVILAIGLAQGIDTFVFI